MAKHGFPNIMGPISSQRSSLLKDQGPPDGPTNYVVIVLKNGDASKRVSRNLMSRQMRPLKTEVTLGIVGIIRRLSGRISDLCWDHFKEFLPTSWSFMAEIVILSAVVMQSRNIYPWNGRRLSKFEAHAQRQYDVLQCRATVFHNLPRPTHETLYIPTSPNDHSTEGPFRV